MASNLQIIINGVDQASDTFGDVGNAMDSLTGKAGGLLSKGLGPLQSMLGTGLKVAAGVAATAVGGLAAGLASSVSDAADFQQGMADIQASMGASTEETAQLKNLILDLGIDPKLKVSAEEAAQAIGQLGTAGVSIDDIMNGAARSTVLLANATGADFADAASIASDVSKLWSIDAGDLTHAVDGITAATVASKFNINDYRLALAQAGGVASTVGVSFDDFNATIAAISPSFASGSDAGTSLKVLLQRLVPSSDKAKDAMKDLGLMTALTGTRQQAYQKMLDEYKGKLAALGPKTKENAKDYKGLSDAVDNLTSIMQTGQNAFFDEKGNMKSMAEVAGILNKAFKGLSEEQKNQYLSTIFGTDAMRAAAALAKMTTGDFENLQTTMAKTDAAESAKTRMDTLKGSLEILSGTFDTLKLMVGDKFLPVLNDLVKRFNDFLGAQAPMIVEWAGVLATKLGDLVTNYLPSFITKLGEWWNWAKQLAGTLVDVGNQVWGFIVGVKAALQPVIDFIGRFIGLKEILLGVAAAFGVSAVVSIASFVASLAPVLLLLGEAIAVVTVLYTAWTNNFGGIREIVGGVLNYLYDRFHLLWDFIRLFGPGALEEITSWVTGTRTQFENLGKIWEQVRLTAQVLFNDLVSWVSNGLPKWIATLQSWGVAAWQWLADAIPIALAKLGAMGSALWSWLSTNLPKWLENLATWGTAMWQWIGDNIPKAIDKLTEWVKSMGTWVATGDGNTHLLAMFGTMGTTMLTALGKIGLALGELALAVVQKLIKIFVDNLPMMVAKLEEWGTALWNWIQGNWPTWKAKLLEWGAALWQWIVEVTPTVLVKLGEWATALFGWFISNLPTWLAKLGEWGAALWQWIVDVTPTVLAKLGEWLGKLGQWLIDNLPTWAGKLAEWGAALWGWIANTVPQVTTKLSEWGSSIWTWFSNEKPGWSAKLSGWGSDIMGKLGEGFSAAKEAVGTTLQTALNEVQTKGLGFATGELLGKMYEGGKGFMTQLGAGINAAAPDLKNDINTAFNGVLTAFNYWHDNLSPHFLASAKDLFGKIGVGLSSIDFGAGVNGAFTALLNAYNKWHDDLAPHFFGSAKDLAANLINGLVEGIKAGIGKVVAAIDGVTEALPQWVKDKLGIHSPSTVFAGLGQNIMEGLVQGMQSMAGAPQAVLSDMTAGMMTGVTGNSSTVNNTTSTTNTWNVNLPVAGGGRPADEMRTTFNLLTSLYAS